MIMRSGRAGGQVCIDKHREDNGCSITVQPDNVNTSQISESHPVEIFLSGNMGILVFSHLDISAGH